MSGGLNFGIVVTGQQMDRYIDQTNNTLNYSTATAAGASVANPFLQSINFTEAPRVATRRSLSMRADWRIRENSVLTFGLQASSFLNKRSIVDMTINASATLTPTIANGQRLSFNQNETLGATGRGSVSMLTGADFHQLGRTRGANLRYRFNQGAWKIDAVADYSISVGAARYASATPGRFRNMAVSLNVPVRVEFLNIGKMGPGTVRLFDNNNREVSLSDIRNYQLASATDTPRDFDDEFVSAKLDVRRRLKWFALPVSLQAGGSTRTQTRDARRHSYTWNYTGPADLSYLTHQVYRTREDSRFTQIPWVSGAKAWASFQANPALFTQTPQQVVAARTFSITNSENMQEEVRSLYGQLALQPFERLTVLGGVRYESTGVEGLGPLTDPTAVWVRNADGSFARTATGGRIRKTEAGAPGSLEELALVRKERRYHADRTYDGYYPSVHATYGVVPNLLARASFASTYGRPNFTDIIPNTDITELDSTGAGIGRITVRNPGLMPWSAKNYDLSLEYYTNSGGLFSFGAFRKNIVNFFSSTTRTATVQDLQALDLDPQYVGWEIVTTENTGSARVDGFEFNAAHSLAPLGAWGRLFHVFVNGTKLDLDGNQRAVFNSFVPASLNWGASFHQKRIRIIARWNHRGEQFKSLVNGIGTNGAQYVAARTLLDLNLEFRLTRGLVLFSNLQNVGKVSERTLRYADETPAYARLRLDINNGTLLTFGIKGTY